MTTSYPRLSARTARFTLGIPRQLTVTPDGRRVRYLRTDDGVSRTGRLWEHDVESGEERVLVDPDELLDGDEELTPQERARRERTREQAAGIVAYALDDTGRSASFALSGAAHVADLAGGTVRRLPTPAGVIDPRVDPTGRLVAYSADGELRVVGVDGTHDRPLASPESPTQVWGQAEFIAAEEMHRFRGFWWAPDGSALLAECYDDAEVPVWHVADPANPDRPAVEQRYPAAGTTNSDVTLWVVGLDGERVPVQWDRDRYEYVSSASWTAHGEPVVQVMTRDQREARVLAVDVADGSTRVLRELSDPHWIEITAPPRFVDGGSLLTLEDVDGVDRVCLDGEPLGDATWQVRSIVSTHPDAVVVTASQEPTEVQVLRLGRDGSLEPVTGGAAVHGAAVGGDTTVITRSGLDAVGTTVTVHRDGAEPGHVTVASEPAPFEPQVTLMHAGDRSLRTAVLFPRDHVPGSRRLPVLLDPYGGPGAQRVLASARMFLEPQWLADQGFCVIVADGRGSPGRGADWTHAIRDAFAEVTLADQVDALHAVAQEYPDDLDLHRVAMTGWSYGGYLSALAVLARPDVFHAAVAGAPVTEWRLYDTCYTERYLGHPEEQPDVYDRNSLLPLAADLTRPLMLIHGLADDNVVAAHTLRLSSALLAAGKAHTVLPLSGVTHMTPQEEVAENLKLLQVDFLKQHLGM